MNGYAAEVPDSVDAIEEAWSRERPDIDFSSIGVITRVWRIARHLERLRQEELTAHGTDRGMLDVMAELRRAGAPYQRSAGYLKEHTLVSSGGLSQRLDRLESAGLVTRAIGKEDRRVIDVQLTEEGVELIDRITADLMERESKVLASLTKREQQQLKQLLKKLLAHFE